MAAFSVQQARAQFPSLDKEQIFADNAGGSQVLGAVGDSVRDYILKTNVQLGASYQTSKIATGIYGDSFDAAAKWIHAEREEIAIGSSTTQLLRNLSFALKFEPGDELIISQLDHETNIDPWTSIAEIHGLTVKWWTSDDPTNPKLTPENLSPLLTQKTKFVACTHASNILGSIHDIKAIAKKVHEFPNALLMVDGVAYAPHREINVKELGVDFYAFSWYKVYGPHVAQLYASKKAQEQLRCFNHFFNPSTSLADKLGFAGAPYELLQAIPRVVEYFGSDPSATWAGMTAHEEVLQTKLLNYLSSRENVTVLGEKNASSTLRVPTISFVVKGRSSKDIVDAAEAIGPLGFRYGHFFSYRLAIEKFGLEKSSGVVRISLVHYNTEEEVQLFIDTFDKIL